MLYVAIGAWLCFMFAWFLGRREFTWYEHAGHAVLAGFVYCTLWLAALSGL